jgi:WD repeat-containing protein 35
LAEASLEELELEMAEKGFVRCEDYSGIQFVKQLRHLDRSPFSSPFSSTWTQR